MPPSKEEVRAKSEATRLKNLRRRAENWTLTTLDKKILAHLEAKERSGSLGQIAHND